MGVQSLGLLEGYSSDAVVSRQPLKHWFDVTGNNVCQSDGTLCGLFKQCWNKVCREIYTYMITKLFVALLNIYFEFGYDMLHPLAIMIF